MEQPRANSFHYYLQFYETGVLIPDDKLRGEYFEAVPAYAFYGIQPKDPMVKALLNQVAFAIDNSFKKKKTKSEAMEGNSNALKDWENISKQGKTVQNSKKQNKTIRIKDKDKGIRIKDKDKGIRDKDKDNNNKNNKIIYSSDFDLFRSAYPIRKGKQKAYEAWNNAIKGGNDPNVITQKAREYALECKNKKTEEGFIKRPQGWLNDGRYDDDYDIGFTGKKPDLDELY